MKLNTEKIERELKRLGRTKGWLAGKCAVERATVKYWFDVKTINAAERIGKALDIEAKDLIK